MYPSYSFEGDVVNAEVHRHHLQFLTDIVQVDYQYRRDDKDFIQEQRDAFTQLAFYFPYTDQKEGHVDWWLTSQNPEKPRMQAVKQLSETNELVDWVQSRWAYDVFSKDWLAALYNQDHVYWQENSNIVNHAWTRWQKGDGLEWLQIAIRRVHPKDKLANDIIGAAKPFLTQDIENIRDKTLPYRRWLADISKQLVRIYLGRGDYDSAYNLIRDYPLNSSFMDIYSKYSEIYHDPYGDSISDGLVIQQAVRWLIYVNQIQQARRFAFDFAERFDSRKFRFQLAQDVPQALEILFGQGSPYRFPFSPDFTGLGHQLVRLLPLSVLAQWVDDVRLPTDVRARLALAVFTRSFLLEKPTQNLREYAIKAVDLTPSLREIILGAFEGDVRANLVDVIMRQPRMQAIPNLINYADKPISADIDTEDHNDNNWWCRYNAQAEDGRFFNQYVISPDAFIDMRDRDKDTIKGFSIKDFDRSDEKARQVEFLRQHPLYRLIDHQERAALEKIPMAPEYFARTVIPRAEKNSILSFFGFQNDPKNAANLHYLVRTTRYGCQRNGSHEAYSKRAFDILHKNYKKSIWTKATPFWFSCRHFREPYRCSIPDSAEKTQQ